MAKGKITEDDFALLDELGIDTTPDEFKQYTPKEERIIAGFEEIIRFVEEQNRLPQHGDGKNIFERLYAVRLDRLRASKECRDLLSPMDHNGVLGEASSMDHTQINMSDEDLLSTLGIEITTNSDDLTQLKYVRSREEINAAEEIAKRDRCEDFETFKPIFDAIKQDLQSGERQTIKFENDASVKQGDVFILDGQTVLIANVGESYINDYGKRDSRLRVVFANGTESDMLLRSLTRALNKDDNSRRIIKVEWGLFADSNDEESVPTGHIYVLRSNSDIPYIAENRSVIHKIGVTGGDVKQRIANAKKDPTYLLADVEIVATFKLANINRTKLEKLLHKFFGSAQLDVELKDRFNMPVKPREWFLVPLKTIEEVIERIIDGTIDLYSYDPETAQLIRLK